MLLTSPRFKAMVAFGLFYPLSLIHNGVDEGIVLQDQMDSLGARLDDYRTSGARAYLYDFSSPTQLPARRDCGVRRAFRPNGSPSRPQWLR
jgi:hypothetical protein